MTDVAIAPAAFKTHSHEVASGTRPAGSHLPPA
jgi:hypothetical protein